MQPSDDAPSRAHAAATNAAIETVMNCYMREGGEWRPVPAATVPALAQEGDTFLAVLPFVDERSALLAGVRYLSPTHRHRFRLPVQIAMAGGAPWPVGFDTLIGMLADHLGDTALSDDPIAAKLRGPDPTFLLSRIRQSVENVRAFLDARADDIDVLWSAEPLSFIASEQALLLGSKVHPTVKSRWEMSPEQAAAYAPEMGARFALHWLAVDPEIVDHASAGESSAPQLTEALLRGDGAVDGAALDAALDGLGARVLLPVHPWELQHLREHDALVQALFEDGSLVDLGPLGGAVTPTTSVRTVYNEDWSWQLGFSLHVQMTDRMSVSPAHELRRAVEATRMLRGGVGEAAARIAPDLVLLSDEAYLAVRHGGSVIDGLSVLLRENRWRAGSGADVSTIAALVQDHPYDGSSRLGQIVARLAEQDGRGEDEIAREWFGRFLEIAAASLLALYVELGIAIETDAQNTLLELEGGWPARAVVRESQRYRHREAAHEDILADAPSAADHGAILAESAADRRLAHPFLDSVLGVVNALGAAGAVDEVDLLGDLKALLERERERGGRYPATLLDRLLDDATWPVQANLRTRLHNLEDRYVDIPNPLHGVR